MIKQLAAMPRYEAYKDLGIEWIGKIPKHWELKRLRLLVREHSGYGFPIELQGDNKGTVPFLKVSDFSPVNRYLSGANNFVSEKIIQRKGWKKVPVGSLVTAKIGEALRKNHRNIVSVEALIDNNCIAFHPVDMDVLYFFYLNRIIDFDWFVNPGAVPSISIQKYKSLKVPVPTESEQTTIANFLDQKTTRTDLAIVIKEEQIALLKERKQILIQNAVTRGLNPDAPMRNSGVEWIGNIPEHWQIIRLKVLFTETNERTKTGEEVLFSLRMEHGLVPHEDVSDKYISDENLVDYKVVYPGQMIMNRMRAAIGIFGLATAHGLVSPDYAVFDIGHNANPEYFLRLFKMPLLGTQFRLHSKGLGTGSSGFMRLYTENFGNIKIALPSVDEQGAIVKYIETESSKIDKAITLLQQQIRKLKEYKATLINSAVTGKIKVA